MPTRLITPPAADGRIPRPKDTTPLAIDVGRADSEWPTRLGPYDLLDELGRGGMGIVLRGRDRGLRRDVAIKFLLPESREKPELRLRFLSEARITGRLEHPGVVPVHCLGRDRDGREFFAMKLVAGRPLDQLLADWHVGDARTRRDFPLARLLSLFERVCETIAFAHAHGVLHRDLKPGNVQVGDHGEVWVLDWGLAATLAGAPLARQPGAGPAPLPKDARLTIEGHVLGTPAYMPPEQARGEDLDQRADVYGLGALLFHLLVGRPPARGRDTLEVVRCVALGDLRDIAAEPAARGLPRALIAIVRAALAPDRTRRYASVGALLADVRRYLAGEPVAVAPEGPLRRLWRRIARHPRVAVAAAGAAGLVLLTVAVAASVVARESALRATALEAATHARVVAARAADDAAAARGELGAESARRAAAETAADRARADRAAAAQRRAAAFQPYARAMDLVRRGQRLDEAIALAREALATDADFVEAAFLLGEALRAHGEARPAAEAFLRADTIARHDIGRHSAAAALAAALAYESGGWMAESASAFDLLGDEVSDPLAEVGRALRDLRGLAYTAARARVDALVQAEPDLWEAHYARARVYGELIEDGVVEPTSGGAEALASARRAVALAPNQALAQAQLAMSATEQAEADAAVERAIALEPANGAWLVVRADAAFRLGRVDDGRRDTEAARRLGVAPARLALVEARAAMLVRDLEANFRALATLKDRLAGWPKQEMAWAYVGLVLGHHEVDARLRELIARYPRDPAMAHAGAALAEADVRHEDALALVRRALADHPFHAQLRLEEAFLCHRCGRDQEALALLDRIPVDRLAPPDLATLQRVRDAATRGARGAVPSTAPVGAAGDAH